MGPRGSRLCEVPDRDPRVQEQAAKIPAEKFARLEQEGAGAGIADVTVYGHGAENPGSQGDADCRSDGVTIVAIFNSWSSDGSNQFPSTANIFGSPANVAPDRKRDRPRRITNEDQFPKYFKKPKKPLQMPPRERIPRLVTPLFEVPSREVERRFAGKVLS